MTLTILTDFRKKSSILKISDFAKEMFIRLDENHNISLVEWDHDKDHVHILFKAHPNTEMSKFINVFINIRNEGLRLLALT
nr:transposase [Aneurinibacillus aneurinilyticus]